MMFWFVTLTALLRILASVFYWACWWIYPDLSTSPTEGDFTMKRLPESESPERCASQKGGSCNDLNCNESSDSGVKSELKEDGVFDELNLTAEG